MKINRPRNCPKPNLEGLAEGSTDLEIHVLEAAFYAGYYAGYVKALSPGKKNVSMHFEVWAKRFGKKEIPEHRIAHRRVKEIEESFLRGWRAKA